MENIKDEAWIDLTFQELDEIKDLKKQGEYRRQINFCYLHVINPLYSGIKDKSKFKYTSDRLTCKNMMDDLTNYYYKKGFTKEEIIKIIKENDFNKRY